MKMKIITRVDYIDVPDDIWQLPPWHNHYTEPVSSYGPEAVEPMSFTTELIRGRRIVMNNIEYCIGNSVDVENVLGMQMELLDNTEQKIIRSYNKGYNKGHYDGISIYKDYYWKKIKSINDYFQTNTNYWWMPLVFYFFIGLILL